MNLFIFAGKKKSVVKHPMMTANHKEQTSQVNDFNLMILVLHVWQDAGIQEPLNFLLLYGSYLGWDIQAQNASCFTPPVNSPQGTLLADDSGHQFDPYKTGMVGNILFFISLNPFSSNAVVK